MEIKFTKDALDLLYRYAKYCCYHNTECENNKEKNSIDNLMKIFPNATSSIVTLAENYGINEISEVLVHAYFFTYHNQMHEKSNKEYHKAYLAEVIQTSSNMIVVRDLIKREKRKVLNIYNIKIDKGNKVIIHASYIVTNHIPEYLERLHNEKDIRAWEPHIRGR